MATPDHLAILQDALAKDDIEIWNQWRRDNPDIIPDLMLANLRDANLRDANLYRADLDKANLSFTNLRDANLSFTSLGEANLRKSDLRGADVSDAYLLVTNFTTANLTNTKFNRSKCYETIFVNVDLSQTKNLSSIVHFGASSVGIDTLYKSRGNIPRDFLEGCGIPETMITFAKSLVGQAIEFNSCFISYSSQDEDFAKHLYGQMKAEKMRVWFAPEDMKMGRKIHEQLYEAIHLHDRFLLILSEHSIQSNWVESEIRRARKRERDEGRQILFPISLLSYDQLRDWILFDADEGRDLAQEIREYFIRDFSDWKDHHTFQPLFQKLVNDLRKS